MLVSNLLVERVVFKVHVASHVKVHPRRVGDLLKNSWSSLVLQYFNQSYSAVAVQPKRDRLNEVVDLGGKQCRTFVIKTLTNFANNDLVGTPNLPNPVNVEVWGPQFGGISLGQSQEPSCWCQRVNSLKNVTYSPLSSTPCNRDLFTASLVSYQKRVMETFEKNFSVKQVLEKRRVLPQY